MGIVVTSSALTLKYGAPAVIAAVSLSLNARWMLKPRTA